MGTKSNLCFELSNSLIKFCIKPADMSQCNKYKGNRKEKGNATR